MYTKSISWIPSRISNNNRQEKAIGSTLSLGKRQNKQITCYEVNSQIIELGKERNDDRKMGLQPRWDVVLSILTL